MDIILIAIKLKALPDRMITQKKNMEQFKEIKKALYEGLQGVELKFWLPEKCKIQLYRIYSQNKTEANVQLSKEDYTILWE